MVSRSVAAVAAPADDDEAAVVVLVLEKAPPNQPPPVLAPKGVAGAAWPEVNRCPVPENCPLKTEKQPITIEKYEEKKTTT
jgi:hypothetical protein